MTPMQDLSFLLQPTEFGAQFDRAYALTLMCSGIWLILFVWARVAAIAALLLIVAKYAIMRGWLLT